MRFAARGIVLTVHVPFFDYETGGVHEAVFERPPLAGWSFAIIVGTPMGERSSFTGLRTT